MEEHKGGGKEEGVGNTLIEKKKKRKFKRNRNKEEGGRDTVGQKMSI